MEAIDDEPVTDSDEPGGLARIPDPDRRPTRRRRLTLRHEAAAPPPARSIRCRRARLGRPLRVCARSRSSPRSSIFVFLALRRRTLALETGTRRRHRRTPARLWLRALLAAEHRRRAHAAGARARELDVCARLGPRIPRGGGVHRAARPRRADRRARRRGRARRRRPVERLFFLVWFAAAAGDTTGYYLGRWLGRDFLMRHGPRFRITPNVVARVEAIFNAHGGKAIILGRFVGIARAITPFLAGTSHIPCGASSPSTSRAQGRGRPASWLSATCRRERQPRRHRSRTRSGSRSARCRGRSARRRVRAAAPPRAARLAHPRGAAAGSAPS